MNKEHGTSIVVDDPTSKAQFAQQIQRIREAAEKAKIELSQQDVTTVSLPFLMPDAEGQMINFELNMTRKQLEGLVQDLVDKTIEPCKKALADAGLSASDLDEIILVGGQTRMPKVIEVVKKYFGKEPRRDVNPDEIVAMGASVQGAILDGKIDDVLLLDVIPLSIGLRTKGDVMTTLIERNSTIPTEFTDVFSTAEDNQRNVDIQIFQGERAKASENKRLGNFTLDGIPPARGGEPQIEVKLAIDADGVLNVQAKDLKTGRAQKITVKANGGLSEDEVARMLKDADANAEKDRQFRTSLAAEANSEYELKEAKKDESEDYFKQAPEELKKQFADTVKELTEARAKKDVTAMLEKTQKLKDVRIAIGEAFSNAAAPANDDAATATPAAAEEKKVANGTTPAPKKPNAPNSGA